MMELIIVVIALVISFYAGMRYREIKAARNVKQYIEAYSLLEQVAKESIIRVVIVKDNDTFLVYREDNNAFLAQGKNHSEIKKILRARFPDSTFMATPQNIINVGYIIDDSF